MKFTQHMVYITNDGSTMVIDHIIEGTPFPIIGRIKINGTWCICMWHGDGTYDDRFNGLDIKTYARKDQQTIANIA